MKKRLLISLAAFLSLAAGAGLQAKGRNEQVEINFSELKGMTDNKGRTLDGSIKFYFADEKAPMKGGEEISARGNTFQKGDDIERCKRAMLAAFISFQERAKRDEKTMVVGVRTFYDNGTFSKSRSRCLCAAGGRRVGTTVRGRLAGGSSEY
jgi:hypothetical protein